MSDVTLRPAALNAGHPALTSSGQWTARARHLLANRTVRSRSRNPFFNPPADPIRNTALFCRIADEIEVFPQSHEQTMWSEPDSTAPCGTAFCIAGHAAHFTGWKPVNGDWGHVRAWSGSPLRHVVQVARHELGLTAEEGMILFNAYWARSSGLSAPDALRALGKGASIMDVTQSTWLMQAFPSARSRLRAAARSTG